jgi:hypothetical protein
MAGFFTKKTPLYPSQHLSTKIPSADNKQTKTLPVRQGLLPQGSTKIDCIQYFICPAVRPDWNTRSD